MISYGLDANLVTPPFSAFFALMMIAGCDALGVRVARLFGLLGAFAPAWHRFQAPIIGVMLLSAFLYPLALAGLTARIFLQFIAVGLLVCGAVHIFNLLRRSAIRDVQAQRHFFRMLFSLRIWYLLLALLLIGMGLTALGPSTNADSLAYHMGIPIYILNAGSFPFAPEWFHSRISGSGEVLNALGLSIGSEQFGSLLQFSGLIGIVGLFICGETNELNCERGSHLRPILAVAAASSPVLLFLVSSSKPQLIYVAMTTLSFALVVFPSRRYQTPRQALLGFALICLLVMTASQAKFSFLLGGGVVGLIAIVMMARQRLLIPSLVIGILISLVVLVPPLLWKHFHFGGSLIDALIKPFPGDLPGYDDFDAFLRGYRDSPVPFPLSLVIPSGPGTVTTILGAGLIFLLSLRPFRDPWAWTLLSAALFATVIGACLGQVASRFYLEPYYWLLMAVLITPVSINNFESFNWARWVILGQAILTIAFVFFGALTLFPGAVNEVWRVKVMESYANGYSLMRWADSVLPADAVLLSGHRSVALAPRQSISMDWVDFVNFNTAQPLPYLLRLKQKGVTHMLVIGDTGSNGPFKRCLGKTLAGPWYGRSATRNPFNVGEQYTAWMVEFKLDRLPNCALPETVMP